MAGEVVGKATYETELDRSGLQEGLAGANADIAKTGAATEAAFGKSAAEGPSKWGAAVKVAAGTGAVAFAGLGAAALQAQDAQGKFMAATGASREEAKQAVRDMDSLAGSTGAVGKSFTEVSGTFTAVSQQFGIQGDKAKQTTEAVLEYSKVTGGDAVQSAGALEDTLSAFGLTADDARGFLDTLIASSQKYGTEVGPEMLGQLQSMAPALQTMGLNANDAVGFLNAMETAGVDSSGAVKDLTAVIKSFPPGTTLDDVVAKLGAVEDPAKRGQLAVELLGQKAGPQLAKIVQPGMTSLQDFGVSATEAQGSLETAAGAMDTDADKVRGALDKIMAGARDVGQEFGPALTGLASLGSLAAPLIKGGADLIGKFASAVLPTAVAAGAARGAAEGEAEAAASTGAGVLSGWLAKFGLLTPAKVAAAAAAGAAEGAAEGEAAAAGMAGAAAAGGAGSGALAAAGGILGGGILSGAAVFLAGAAAVAGLAAALGALAYGAAMLATSSDPKMDQTLAQMNDFGQRAAGALGDGFSDEVKQNYAQVVADAIATAGNAGSGLTLEEAQKQGLMAGQEYLASLGEGATDPNATVGIGKSIFNQVSADTAANFSGPQWQDIWAQIGTGAGTTAGEAAGNATYPAWAHVAGPGFSQAAGAVGEAAYPAWAHLGEELTTAAGEAASDPNLIEVQFGPFPIMVNKFLWGQFQNGDMITLGKTIPTDIATGIVDAGKDVMDAGDRLVQLLKEGLTPAEEAAKLEGKKYTKAVAEGVKSEIPGAKEASQQMAVAAIKTIEDAADGTPNQKGLKAIGSYYDSLLASGLDAKSVAVALAAAGVSSDVIAKLTGYYPDFTDTGEAFDAHLATGVDNASNKPVNEAGDVGDAMTGLPWGSWGNNAGDAWVNGIKTSIGSVQWNAWMRKHVPDFEANSPPKVGYLKDIGKWGYNTGEAWAEGMQAGLATLDPQVASLQGQLQPLLTANGGLEVRHVVELDLRNAPAGVTNADVAAMLQPVVDFDALWRAKMGEAQAATGVRWVQVAP